MESLGLLLLRIMAVGLLKTELIEVGTAALLPGRRLRDLRLTFIVNVITNPPVVFLTFVFGHRLMPFWLWCVLIEGTVWAVEALLYRGALEGRQNPWLYALLLNALSFASSFLPF